MYLEPILKSRNIHMFHIFSCCEQKPPVSARVNLNSFSFFYSARSVPLPYTSCTMTLSDGIPYRYDGLSYQKTGITEALYHSGCTACAPLRQPPPGYGVSSSQFRMAHTRMHHTSGNMQVSACCIWRKKCNPNGELSDGYSCHLLLFAFFVLKTPP